MLTPEDMQQEMKEFNETKLEILKKNPWLIPATISLTTVPLVIAIHGFWKNRQLSKKLKIEREKTKQLMLEQRNNNPKYHPFKF